MTGASQAGFESNGRSLATATPDLLQRRFLQTGGVILNHGNEVIARLDRRAYSPVLRQADLPTVTVPWWGNRRLSYQIT